MARLYWLLSLVIAALVFAAPAPEARAAADLPKPTPYPVSWDLKFDYKSPTRIVVNGQAYWYLPYTVTNTTGEEQMFLPIFQLVSADGKITRSDRSVPPAVIEAVKKQEGNKFIQSSIFTSGEIRLGETESRHGVAVWAEASPRMGRFSILVGGLSGEYKKVKGPEGKEVILRKTLQLNYFINGDEVYPGEDQVNVDASEWIMH